MDNTRPFGFYLSLLGKQFKKAVREECNKIGINGTYSSIIMILAHHKEGIPQNMIAEKCHLAAPTVSLTLRNMEQENIIERCGCSEDSRKVIVKLTDYGFELDKKIIKCFDIVEKQIIKDIPEDDLQLFRSILDKMLDNLEFEVKEDV